MNFLKKWLGRSSKQEEQSENVSAQPHNNVQQQLTGNIASQDQLSEEERELLLKMLGRSEALEQNTPDQFKTELYASLQRYYSVPDLEINLNLTDAEGNTYLEHEAFDGTYAHWKGIRSVSDRRGVLFAHWDESELTKLAKWQVLERWVKDRYPTRALAFFREQVAQEDFQDIRLIVALSKLYRCLDMREEAMHYAKGAYELRPDLDMVKVEYANMLHISGDQSDRELAHTLFNGVLEGKISKDSQTKIGLLNYFLFGKDYLDSSIFAIHFLRAGNADSHTWEILANEYYWCPIFRMEHAVFLSNDHQELPAIAKLSSLADEFPWFKQGVLGFISAIAQLRVQKGDPDFMSEDMERMERYKSSW